MKRGNVLNPQIAVILNIKPKKLAKLFLSKIEVLGGMDLFRKPGAELEFIVFSDLDSEYNEQWTGKDKNQRS